MNRECDDVNSFTKYSDMDKEARRIGEYHDAEFKKFESALMKDMGFADGKDIPGLNTLIEIYDELLARSLSVNVRGWDRDGYKYRYSKSATIGTHLFFALKSGICYKSDCIEIKYAASRSEKLRSSRIKYLHIDKHPVIRSCIAKREDLKEEIIEVLSRDIDESVRVEIAKQKDLNKDLIERYIHDEHYLVRGAVVAYQNITEEQLEKACNDKHILVRAVIAVAKYNITDRQLERLSNDCSSFVREKVAARNDITKDQKSRLFFDLSLNVNIQMAKRSDIDSIVGDIHTRCGSKSSYGWSGFYKVGGERWKVTLALIENEKATFDDLTISTLAKLNYNHNNYRYSLYESRMIALTDEEICKEGWAVKIRCAVASRVNIPKELLREMTKFKCEWTRRAASNNRLNTTNEKLRETRKIWTITSGV